MAKIWFWINQLYQDFPHILRKFTILLLLAITRSEQSKNRIKKSQRPLKTLTLTTHSNIISEYTIKVEKCSDLELRDEFKPFPTNI